MFVAFSQQVASTKSIPDFFSGQIYSPENERMSPKKGTISVGNTSSNHWFSGDMLVFGGVDRNGGCLAGWICVVSLVVSWKIPSVPRKLRWNLKITTILTRKTHLPNFFILEVPCYFSGESQKCIQKTLETKTDTLTWNIIKINSEGRKIIRFSTSPLFKHPCLKIGSTSMV